MIPAANETPVDLAAVQRDDALLDTLGGGAVGRSEEDAELARVLDAWRRDVDAVKVGELVDIDTALVVIGATSRPRRPRWERAVELWDELVGYASRRAPSYRVAQDPRRKG